MSAVDQRDHSVVIRVVYDGPPEAGKTTSIRALARGFGREVYTPEEQDGRTVFFDWLEHTGGRFDGGAIRCEIASVPGQRRWQRRRLHFIDKADAIVFVGDTSSVGWSESIATLRRLLERLRKRGGPPVGVVFQANRRDAPDAVPLAIVREQIPADNVAVIESVAIDGSGVREAFVFAVRLALDRVREEQRSGQRTRGGAGPSADEVLDELRLLGLEPEPGPEAAPSEAAPDAPRTPSDQLPSGFVWPPIEGRIVLREAAKPDAIVRLDGAGDFEATLATGWHAHSVGSAVFATVDDGRDRLITWARLHVAAQAFLSKQRCLALAETGDGRWRLWQVVREGSSLRDALAAAGEDPDLLARALARASRLLLEARSGRGSDALRLPWSLDTIGATEVGRPIFVGRAPEAPGDDDLPDDDRIASELAAVVRSRAAGRIDEVSAAIRRARAHDFGPPDARVRGRLLELLATAAVDT